MKVVAYGGGTNSTAMLVLMHEQGMRPDLILFADTGGEKPHTYTHVAQVSEWCKSVGFPEITTVKKRGRVYVGETLEENCLRQNMLPSIAYGYKSCSLKYKVQPQDMYCNNHAGCQAVWTKEGKILKFIGYDADETRRAKIFTDDKYAYIYPLISQDWGREECVEAIARVGLQQPGKSACFFCPSSKKAEIIQVRQQYPDLMERALKMEAQANLTSVKGLGRSFSWAEFLQATDAQQQLFSDAGKEMDCGCYDGD
jgi:hypothetical protein